MEYVPNQVSGKGMGIPNLTGVTQKGCMCVWGGEEGMQKRNRSGRPTSLLKIWFNLVRLFPLSPHADAFGSTRQPPTSIQSTSLHPTPHPPPRSTPNPAKASIGTTLHPNKILLKRNPRRSLSRWFALEQFPIAKLQNFLLNLFHLLSWLALASLELAVTANWCKMSRVMNLPGGGCGGMWEGNWSTRIKVQARRFLVRECICWRNRFLFTSYTQVTRSPLPHPHPPKRKKHWIPRNTSGRPGRPTSLLKIRFNLVRLFQLSLHGDAFGSPLLLPCCKGNETKPYNIGGEGNTTFWW